MKASITTTVLIWVCNFTLLMASLFVVHNIYRASQGFNPFDMDSDELGSFSTITTASPTIFGSTYYFHSVYDSESDTRTEYFYFVPGNMEYKFDMENLTDLLVYDRKQNPSNYSMVLVSEGAMFEGGEMVFKDSTTDAYGHKKLGGIGDLVSEELKNRSAKYNNGKKINVINQKLGYMVRGGDPDAIDSIVPMAYGNLALDLILDNIHGRLVVLKNGRYDNIPIGIVTSQKKLVNVKKHYHTERLRPFYKRFEMQPLFLMTSEG